MRPEAGPPPPRGAGVEAEQDAKEHEVASDEGEESDVDMDVETPFLLTSNFPGLPSLDEMEGADLDNLMIWSDVGFYRRVPSAYGTGKRSAKSAPSRP